MNQRIAEKLKALEKERDECLRLTEGLSVDQFNYSLNGKWSCGQVLSHLIVAEELSLAYVKRLLAKKKELRGKTFKSTLKNALLILALKSPFKFKAPAFTTNFPPTITYQSVADRWEKVRLDLHEVAEGLPENVMDKTIFTHQIGGPMTFWQMLDFFEHHIKHHKKQLAKVGTTPISLVQD